MQYNDSYNDQIFAYANSIFNIEGGTHLSGFRTALTRVINGFARGNNLIIDNPAESDELLVKQFPKISPSVLRTVMSHSRSTFRRNLRMTKSGWDNMHKVYVAVGLLKSELNTSEGELWTNQYLPQ
jgi:hypothetical protein